MYTVTQQSGDSDEETQSMHNSPPSRYVVQPDLAQPEEVQILSPSSTTSATSPIAVLSPGDGAHTNAGFSTSPSIANALSSSPPANDTDMHQEAAASLNGDHSESSTPRLNDQRHQQQQQQQQQGRRPPPQEEEQEESRCSYNIFRKFRKGIFPIDIVPFFFNVHGVANIFKLCRTNNTLFYF